MTHEEKGIQILVSAARLRAPQLEEMLRLHIQTGNLKAEGALLERLIEVPGARLIMGAWVKQEIQRIAEEAEVMHSKMLALAAP